MDELTRALLPVVADPDQVALLYTRLREFCHDIRNMLSVYRIQLYMARRDGIPGLPPGDLDQVEQRYQSLEQFITGIQGLCRPLEPMRMHVSVTLVLDECQRCWAEQLGKRGSVLLWNPPHQVMHGHLDPILLRDAMEAFVAWRVQVGEPQGLVKAGWRAEPDRLRLHWDEPACETSRAAPRLPSLALATLARVLGVHGGRMSVEDEDGFHLEIILPTARSVLGDPVRISPGFRSAAVVHGKAHEHTPCLPVPGFASGGPAS